LEKRKSRESESVLSSDFLFIINGITMKWLIKVEE
jgi:hypothetical protein